MQRDGSAAPPLACLWGFPSATAPAAHLAYCFLHPESWDLGVRVAA